MSRCFPFPPPGYFRNIDALKLNNNEPIKIHLDIEKPKKDRKEKKDKKERKREKKEKKEKRKVDKEKKHREDSKISLVSATSIKFKLNDEIKEKPEDNAKLLQLQKGLDYESEQLERSGITEELDQPVCSPQEPYSSDSSQSSKRKRGTLLQPSKEHGPAIRIRLPLRKQREPEESTKQVYQLGSSSRGVRVAVSVTQETSRVDRLPQQITKVENKQLHENSDFKVCKPLQRITNLETKQVPASSDSKACKPLQNLAANEKVDKESRRMESLYNSLLHIQPITYDQFDSLDQDWLFSSVPTEAKPISKKQKTEVLQCSQSLWPRAQYMPEVDIYALPYTVPF